MFEKFKRAVGIGDTRHQQSEQPIAYLDETGAPLPMFKTLDRKLFEEMLAAHIAAATLQQTSEQNAPKK